jgi:hypothetical protein
LTFLLNGTTVYTDASTHYRAGNCKHIESGRRVVVAGQRQGDGRVRAERIDIEKND